MTVDTPLTCYMCGETSDRATVDMLGCLKDQGRAGERFKEKFGESPLGFLDICSDCQEENPVYADNVREKYGVYQ